MALTQQEVQQRAKQYLQQKQQAAAPPAPSPSAPIQQNTQPTAPPAGNDIQQRAQQYLQQKGITPKPQQATYQAQPSKTYNPDPLENWDYKTSPVNHKGEPLPAGAQSWTPFGQPYFGPGIKGTVEKYKWMLMGSPTQGPDADRWERFQALTASGEERAEGTTAERLKLLGQGLFGTTETQEKSPEQMQIAKDAFDKINALKATLVTGDYEHNADIKEQIHELEEVRRNALGKGLEGKTSFQTASGQSVSLLTPLVRGTKVAVTALMDVLQEGAIKIEQGMGVSQAMREYADEKGSALPGLTFDINRDEDITAAENKSEAAQNITNIASRLVAPVLQVWDTMRFVTAPGTFKEKQAALEEGYDAGRILYSQAIKPALLEELKRRAAAGEDPQLLAMELQNPWAEMAGQFVFDPLNIVGLGAKTAKVAGQIDKANDLVRGGELADEAVELFSDAGKTMQGPLGETRATERMGKFDDILVKNIERVENARLTPDFNKAQVLSPAGMRVKATKQAIDTTNIITGTIMKSGGTAEEVTDFFHYLSKAVSTDKLTRMEAWDNIFTLSQRFNMGRYPFSDDVLEMGVLLKNLLEDKELLTITKAGKGDLAKTAEILSKTFDKAIAKQIPNFGDVQKGAEAFLSGADTSAEAQRFAKTFEGISASNKTKWALHEGKLGKAKSTINSTLGKFYFSQPGFVSRNWSNNMVTMITDSGLKGAAKSYYRESKYWSMADIEDDLRGFFGGQMPSSTKGIENIASEAGGWVAKLNEKVESGFAKRIYWSRVRDTMDKMIRPGVALPTVAEFRAVGMSDDSIKQLVHIIKNEGYGSVTKGLEIYAKKYGDDGLMDVWKRWNGQLSVEEMKGLDQFNLTKQIDRITATAGSPQQIREEIAKLISETKNRAAGAVDNAVGVNAERKGFEFMEGFGKAADEGYIGQDDYNKLSILIEKSEQHSDEFLKALGKARNTVTDPALREQFSAMEVVNSAEFRRIPRDKHKLLNDAAWTFTEKSKKAAGLDVEKMWSQSVLAKRGPAPKGLTPDDFRTELWNATRDEIGVVWQNHFTNGFDKLSPLVDNLLEQAPELGGLFQKSQKASAEMNLYRTADYRGGQIFTQKPLASVTELASRYGVSSATEAGIPRDKQLLNTINKYSDVKYPTLADAEQDLANVERALQKRALEKGKEVTKAKGKPVKPAAKQPNLVNKAVEVPRSELPPAASQRFADEAKRLLDELAGGEAGKRTAEGVTSSTHVSWYREQYKKGLQKAEINKALDKIVMDAGKDKGVNVERMKDMILDNFKFGDAKSGTPPDLYVLKQLGADEKTLQEALDSFNDITKQELSLEDAIRASSPSDEIAGAVDEVTGQPLEPDTSQAYYDDAGNLIEPKNPEVQLKPPYVDGSPPSAGEMWSQNSDGIVAALKKVERYMLDNYGLKAVEKFDDGQLKNLTKLLTEGKNNAAGRVTEAMAISDKVGKEWRDFALLPYGETKNMDLMMSYAMPYQFWYSRSYANWGKRIATDPQVIANYARLKETMSEVNKDSPEWWRYNVEIPSNFLGLGNDHPLSFNIEANLWPLYGLTGTDFNDPQKRGNWLDATVDDMGKFGPSLWAPINWAIALNHRRKGEDEAAQAWGGRVIPQTATLKAASSLLFGKPIELDPMVQMFSGKGIMDLSAMDKYERNRVGRALAAMVEQGLITEEQAVETARTQEGELWDQAVQMATKQRAGGQILSYFLGVGMKARTENDKQIDQFYQDYYRLQNLSEAGLVSPDAYKQSFDDLREKYKFMDTLLLARKAGPDRERAYLYNVLGRIPPGQASDMYKIVGIDPKLAQKFYDSKGDIAGMTESEVDRLMAAGVDLGAMLAIPEYATRQEWTAARNQYSQMSKGMQSVFGEEIQEKIDRYYTLDDAKQKKAFLEANPDIGDALDWQNGQIVNNPLLYEYYGGLDTLDKFYKSRMYDELEQKFGGDVSELWDQYYAMQLADPKGAKVFKRQHPEMERYNKEKKKLKEEYLRLIVDFGTKLPEGAPPELIGNEPQTVAQANIQDYASQQAPDFTYWQGEMPVVSDLLTRYWYGGEKLPSAVTRELDYQAHNYGYENGDELMKAILISMNQQQPLSMP